LANGTSEENHHEDPHVYLSTGSAEVNKKLSRMRAGSGAKFLVNVGNIQPNRIMVTGYGAEKPVASNTTPEGRAANRRVEILIDNR
jgi:chemotaxis protein MotB